MDAIIKVENLTKDYGDRRGVFDASFQLEKGEVFGFLGPNGAGKTTTIRQMLGFIRPDKGAVHINGMNTWQNYYKTNADIGYLPGEINFPEKTTGMEFINWIAEMKGLKNLDRAKELLDMLELKNYDSSMKSMSKGMKQKIGLVCAFMNNPDILILDEPTSGLDPLMQDVFVELIRQEKDAGNTILMSSHMFAEVEKTCDRVAVIKQGEIIASVDMADISKTKNKVFKVKFAEAGESNRFAHEKLDFSEINHEKNRAKVKVADREINDFIAILGQYNVLYISEVKVSLEDFFMHFYSNRAVGA